MSSALHRIISTTAAATAVGALLLVGAGSASAHVRVVPDTTSAGGYAHLTFNVPNESATAATNKVEVKLPTDTPFTYVATKPVEGWTVKLTTTTLPKAVEVEGTTVTKAVTSVVWTADAQHGIGQNAYQSFDLSVGQLPKEGTTVMLPATQTYTDGEVVQWDQAASESGAEPEHPAPAFTTTTTAADAHTHGSASASPTASAQAADVSATSSTSADSGMAAGVWGIVLGGLGLILGAAALVVALGRRRPKA